MNSTVDINKWALTKKNSPALLLIKMTLQAAIIVSIIDALGTCCYWPSPVKIEAVLCGGIICLMATIVSLIPLAKLDYSEETYRVVLACFKGSAIRLSITILIGTFTYFILKPPLTVYLFWTSMFYLALLAWETTLAFKRLKQSIGQKKHNG